MSLPTSDRNSTRTTDRGHLDRAARRLRVVSSDPPRLVAQPGQTDLFRARWTDLINDEWTCKLLEKNPGKADHVVRTRALVDQSMEDCLISDYEEIIPPSNCPTPTIATSSPRRLSDRLT